jgi:DNA polymerase-3 subunit alpha
LVEVLPWGVKERLTQEKTALGFYLSGHLFDEVELEVRRFAKRSIADLQDVREPQWVAGIVSDFRIINGERGRRGVFKLDDKSAAIEVTVDDELLGTHRTQLQDDTLLVVSGKYQAARGGFEARFSVKEIFDLEQARCRFGKYLRVAVHGKGPDVARMVREFPAVRESSEQGDLLRGLAVRLVVQCDAPIAPAGVPAPPTLCLGAMAELHLGEAARFYPSDLALAAWRAQADLGRASIVYE